MTTTLTRRLRLGSGLTQAEAARRIGIPGPNLAAYELGHHRPRPQQLARFVRALAHGKPTRDERTPQYAVRFSVVIEDFLSVGGAAVLFADAETADQHAGRLEAIGLHAVVVVPLWRSAAADLALTRGIACVPYGSGDASASLICHVQRAVADNAQKFGAPE